MVVLGAHRTLLDHRVLAEIFFFALFLGLVHEFLLGYFFGGAEGEVCAAVVAADGEHPVVYCVLLCEDLALLFLEHFEDYLFVAEFEVLFVGFEEMFVDVGVMGGSAVEVADCEVDGKEGDGLDVKGEVVVVLQDLCAFLAFAKEEDVFQTT